MKRIPSLILLAALLSAGCNPETLQPGDGGPAGYVSAGVDIGRDGGGATRSLITIDEERLEKVMLFAFDKSTGNILVYGDNAGENAGRPVVTYQTSKSFQWTLPLDTDMEIYTVANYGDLDLESYRRTTLKRSELEALTFSCPSISALKKLENSGYGLPMTGITAVRLTLQDTSVRIALKKLFAKYNVEFDISDIASRGGRVQAMHLIVENANTTVHYFGSGDRATSASQLVEYDRAKDDQLDLLQQGGHEVTLYMLENCQGDIPGATSWKTVKKDVGYAMVKYCTYLALGLKVFRENGDYQDVNYNIYLGKTDMKSNFDVERNVFKTITLKVPFEEEAAESYIRFTDESPTIEPGGTRTLHYETDLDASEVEASVIEDDNGWFSVQSHDRTAKTVTVQASSSATEGTTFRVRAGSGEVSATKQVTVVAPTVLRYTWKVEPSYIGMQASFEVAGLAEGETLSTFSATGAAYVSVSGSTVSFVPSKEGVSGVVITSKRSLPVSATAVKPVLVSEKDAFNLTLDGAYVYNNVYYADPVTLEKLVQSRFHSTFYSTYLSLSFTVEMVSSASEGLVKTGQSGSYSHFLYTYDIAKLNSSPGYNTRTATAKATPKNYPDISPAEIPVYILRPFAALPVKAGNFDDYSLIPATGTRDDSYLTRNGFSTSSSIEVTWYYPSDLNVPVSALSGYTASGCGVVVKDATSSSQNLMITSGSSTSTTSGTVYVVIKNSRSGSTLQMSIYTVTKTIHLAIGGVRTALTYGGSGGGSLGEPVGASISEFLAGADFASNYRGSESNRYSDWPSEAIRIKDMFKSGGQYAMCVTNNHASGSQYTQGGYSYVYDNVATSSYGTEIPLYERYYFTSGSVSGNTGIWSYSQVSTMHCLREYQSGTLGAVTNSGIRINGNFVIHNYVDLYPSSGGWLASTYCGYEISY